MGRKRKCGTCANCQRPSAKLACLEIASQRPAPAAGESLAPTARSADGPETCSPGENRRLSGISLSQKGIIPRRRSSGGDHLVSEDEEAAAKPSKKAQQKAAFAQKMELGRQSRMHTTEAVTPLPSASPQPELQPEPAELRARHISPDYTDRYVRGLPTIATKTETLTQARGTGKRNEKKALKGKTDRDRLSSGDCTVLSRGSQATQLRWKMENQQHQQMKSQLLPEQQVCKHQREPQVFASNAAAMHCLSQFATCTVRLELIPSLDPDLRRDDEKHPSCLAAISSGLKQPEIASTTDEGPVQQRPTDDCAPPAPPAAPAPPTDVAAGGLLTVSAPTATVLTNPNLDSSPTTNVAVASDTSDAVAGRWLQYGRKQLVDKGCYKVCYRQWVIVLSGILQVLYGILSSEEAFGTPASNHSASHWLLQVQPFAGSNTKLEDCLIEPHNHSTDPVMPAVLVASLKQSRTCSVCGTDNQEAFEWNKCNPSGASQRDALYTCSADKQHQKMCSNCQQKMSVIRGRASTQVQQANVGFNTKSVAQQLNHSKVLPSAGGQPVIQSYPPLPPQPSGDCTVLDPTAKSPDHTPQAPPLIQQFPVGGVIATANSNATAENGTTVQKAILELECSMKDLRIAIQGWEPSNQPRLLQRTLVVMARFNSLHALSGIENTPQLANKLEAMIKSLAPLNKSIASFVTDSSTSLCKSHTMIANAVQALEDAKQAVASVVCNNSRPAQVMFQACRGHNGVTPPGVEDQEAINAWTASKLATLSTHQPIAQSICETQVKARGVQKAKKHKAQLQASGVLKAKAGTLAKESVVPDANHLLQMWQASDVPNVDLSHSTTQLDDPTNLQWTTHQSIAQSEASSKLMDLVDPEELQWSALPIAQSTDVPNATPDFTWVSHDAPKAKSQIQEKSTDVPTAVYPATHTSTPVLWARQFCGAVYEEPWNAPIPDDWKSITAAVESICVKSAAVGEGSSGCAAEEESRLDRFKRKLEVSQELPSVQTGSPSSMKCLKSSPVSQEPPRASHIDLSQWQTATNKSGYIGVSCRRNGRFEGRFSAGKRVSLGTFDTAEEAATAVALGHLGRQVLGAKHLTTLPVVDTKKTLSARQPKKLSVKVRARKASAVTLAAMGFTVEAAEAALAVAGDNSDLALDILLDQPINQPDNQPDNQSVRRCSSPVPAEKLPTGWLVEVHTRKCGIRKDKVFIDPVGKRYRTLKEAQHALTGGDDSHTDTDLVDGFAIQSQHIQPSLSLLADLTEANAFMTQRVEL